MLFRLNPLHQAVLLVLVYGCPSGLFSAFHLFKFITVDEAERKAICAVPSILFRKAFAFEDVAKMTTAIVTNNLYPPAVSVTNFLDTTGYFIVEARPSTTRTKLVFAIVQRVVTTTTDEDAVYLEVVVLIGKGHFGALIHYDVLLLGS